MVFGGFSWLELSDVGAGGLDVDDREAITVVKGVVEMIVKEVQWVLASLRLLVCRSEVLRDCGSLLFAFAYNAF